MIVESKYSTILLFSLFTCFLLFVFPLFCLFRILCVFCLFSIFFIRLYLLSLSFSSNLIWYYFWNYYWFLVFWFLLFFYLLFLLMLKIMRFFSWWISFCCCTCRSTNILNLCNILFFIFLGNFRSLNLHDFITIYFKYYLRYIDLLPWLSSNIIINFGWFYHRNGVSYN